MGGIDDHHGLAVSFNPNPPAPVHQPLPCRGWKGEVTVSFNSKTKRRGTPVCHGDKAFLDIEYVVFRDAYGVACYPMSWKHTRTTLI